VSPSTDTEPPLPCQIQAGSPMRGPRSKTARNTSKRTLSARLNPDPHPDKRHHRGRRGRLSAHGDAQLYTTGKVACWIEPGIPCQMETGSFHAGQPLSTLMSTRGSLPGGVQEKHQVHTGGQ
jgi:hypothetical protein